MAFIAPGFTATKSATYAVHVLDGTLFVAGGYFGYKLVYPQALEFLIGYASSSSP